MPHRKHTALQKPLHRSSTDHVKSGQCQQQLKKKCSLRRAIRVCLGVGENSRPGFPRKNVAPHHGSAWTNSASALGIREVLLGNLGGSRYTSKERDTETGNDDFGASYFSPSLGRWLSPDWSAIHAPVPYAQLTNPQTLNLYELACGARLRRDRNGPICRYRRAGCRQRVYNCPKRRRNAASRKRQVCKLQRPRQRQKTSARLFRSISMPGRAPMNAKFSPTIRTMSYSSFRRNTRREDIRAR